MTAVEYTSPLGVPEHEGDTPDPGMVVRVVDAQGKPIPLRTNWYMVSWKGVDACGEFVLYFYPEFHWLSRVGRWWIVMALHPMA